MLYLLLSVMIRRLAQAFAVRHFNVSGLGYCCKAHVCEFIINRGSYISAHVLLNLLNELGKRDKMRGLPSILSVFRNEFNKFNNT